MIDYNGFKNWCREQELSENTISSYINNLNEYEKYASDDFSKDKIVEFKWDRMKHRKAKTVNHYITAIKKYCKYKGIECDVKKVKVQQISAVENVITLEQFNFLVNNLKQEGKDKYAAYFFIPAKTGARINEFLRFTKQDLDNGYATLFTKGKVRTIYFPKKMYEEIGDVFKGLNPEERLYTNKYGGPMTSRGFNSLFKHYAQKYGIPKEVAHAHGLRHLFAIEFLKRNPNISLLADILGHSGINTTMIYTRESKEAQRKKFDDTVDW